MSQWIDVCSIDDLEPEAGISALVNNQRIAIFSYLPLTDEIYAISDYDPFSNTYSLSRGMVGDINAEPVVAAPIYKQHFSLKTGVCLEDESVKVQTYPVRIRDNRVEICITE